MISLAVATFNLDFGLFLRLKLKFMHSLRNAGAESGMVTCRLDERSLNGRSAAGTGREPVETYQSGPVSRP
jgi:hypothetical protein